MTMPRPVRSLLISVLTAASFWSASSDAHALDPQPFDPMIDPALAAPARFQVPETARSSDEMAGSAAAPIRPADIDDLSAPAAELLIDDVATGLPLGTTDAEFLAAPAGFAPTQRVLAPDGSAPLTAGFAMFKVPVGERFWLAGKGWQRELTPGIKAVVFGAEAKVGLSNRVDLRMGYELMGTNPEQFGLTTSNHSEDSLYAQFRFRF